MEKLAFNPMLRVFKDPELQQQMEANGYVIVPFYNEEEVRYLTEVFSRMHDQSVSGFFSSTFSLNTEYRERANEIIIQVCRRPMEDLLVDYKIWCGSFLVKASDANSALAVHQDMTLLDESVYTGFNIWCPLIDLQPDNGPLYVLPGSHRIVPTLRGSTIPAIYEETHEEILSLMTPVYIKAGTAIIFDQSIIHASPPNHSNQLRVVTNTFFTHRDATIRTCYYDRQINKIEIFEHDDNFMTNYENFGYNIHSRPAIGRSLGYVDYEFPKLTREELVRRYGNIPSKPVQKKKGFLRRIFDI